MIADNIKNVDIYAKISPLFAEAVKLMNQIWQGEKEITEKTVIIPDKLSYFILAPQNRKTVEIKRFEAHRKFIDVHFVLKGSERSLIADPCNLTLTEEYMPERDIAFYTGEGAKDITLLPGDFYITFPWDAHAPDRISHLGDDGLTKAVIKIAVE